MENSVTLLLQKGGKFYGKICLSEEYLTDQNHGGISSDDCCASKKPAQHSETTPNDLFMQTSKNKGATPILNAATEIKESIRNLIFRTGFSPAQETQAWKCFSISKETAIITISGEQYTNPISITASPSQTVGEFLSSNQAILNIEKNGNYRLYTSESQWAEDSMQLGEFGTQSFTLEQAKNVEIKSITGSYIMHFWDSELLSEFSTRVAKLEKNTYSFRLICSGKLLHENEQMRNTTVCDFSTVTVRSRLLAGGERLTCDVDLSNATTYAGKGATDGPAWLIYNEGLNILCRCSNSECKSEKGIVVVQLGYPVLETILPEKFNYQCPACSNIDLSIVTFVVSNARAKFTFLKCSSKKVETVILESTTSDSGDYVLFKESDLSDAEKSEYDYIEIATVKFGMSFSKCQLCNQAIFLDDEKIMKCGRAFHAKCLNESKTCPVCNLSNYKLKDLKEIVASVSSKESFTIHLPNHEFGSCKSADKCVPKYIGLTFMNKSSKPRSTDFSPIDILEAQQRFLTQNLPALIRDTIVNTLVICELRKRDIISVEDEDTLNSMSKQTEKTRELYRIIGTRVGGISALLAALDMTVQSGAAKTLSGYFSQ